MITLLGTSHISKQSLQDVRQAIERKPDFVALELDPPRLHALMSKQKTEFSWELVRRVGLKGAMFALLGAWAERRMGEIVGVAPGSEMRLAYRLAKKNNIPIVCIDQPLEVTLRRFNERLSWKERFRFVGDILSSIFRPKKLPFDLEKVPPDEVIDKLVDYVHLRYPNVYDVLIEQRNHVMATRLARLQDENAEKNILAIVGAGHRAGMEKILSMPTKGDYSYSFSISDANT